MSQSNGTLKISGQRVAIPEPSLGWEIDCRPGGWLIATRKNDDGTTERRRLAVWSKRQSVGLSLGGRLSSFEVQKATRAGLASGAPDDSDLVAQFPGKVRKLLVKAGEDVPAGQPLLQVEAMKMEFTIRAPFAGKVAKWHVTEGKKIMPGDRFLDLEAKTEKES
jgi:geranyl-CoA carboxylase alpha subunit